MIRSVIASFVLVATIVVGGLTPQPVAAVGIDPLSEICSQGGNANSAVCQDRRAEPDTGLYDFIETVVNTILLILGSVAVIMLVVGGFRFVISGGDQAAVNRARDTIIYAIIGLIVAMVAYSIVGFVLDSLKGV